MCFSSSDKDKYPPSRKTQYDRDDSRQQEKDDKEANVSRRSRAKPTIMQGGALLLHLLFLMEE
jgi:hypothetical protein